MRRAFTPRSLNSASCRRSTRFSASTDRRGLIVSANKPTKSASRPKTILAMAIAPGSCHRFGHSSQPNFLNSIFAEHNDRIVGPLSPRHGRLNRLTGFVGYRRDMAASTDSPASSTRGLRRVIARMKVQPWILTAESISASRRHRSPIVCRAAVSTLAPSVPTINRFGSKWISEDAKDNATLTTWWHHPPKQEENV